MQYIEETSMKLKLGNDIQLKVLLVETELERVKFLLRGYLRTRLSKVRIEYSTRNMILKNFSLT